MNTATPTLLLRADANPRIGVGHVMRVMTLGEEWVRIGGEVVLLSHELPAKLIDRAQQLGIRCEALTAAPGTDEDMRETMATIRRLEPLWLVIDGYDLHTLIPRSREKQFPSILAFDDFAIGRMMHANVVIDQNAGTCRDRYGDYLPETTLLLGGSYCLMRREFHQAHEATPRVAAKVGRVLVTLGGADPSNATTDCIRALSQLTETNLQIDVVVGAANPRRSAIEVAAADSPHDIKLLDSVSNMAELMSQADLAIAAPGVTCWELAYMGVPMLLVTLAENQRPNAEYLERTGVARCLGEHAGLGEADWLANIRSLIENTALRGSMITKGRQLIDGLGAMRVSRHLRQPLYRLRPAESTDARRIWEWSNDPEVRSVSFSSDPIPWDSHVAWFQARLADPQCRQCIAVERKGDPIAQVRFDIADDNSATISISLAADVRGKGLGTQLIWMACRELFAETEIDRVEALIKPDNVASIRAFEKAGFVTTGDTEVKQQPARRFVLDRGQCL